MTQGLYQKETIGQILQKDFLDKFDLSQSELARLINIPRARISDIISGKRAISADTDLRLCRYFGLDEGYFLNVQMRIELAHTKRDLKEELKRISPHKKKSPQVNLKPINTNPDFKKLDVAIICGGPSLERGISLNSARSLMDHLSRDEIEIHPIYVDQDKNFYGLSKSQLYSNTPSDFDFKLADSAQKYSPTELVKKLKEIDIVFPVIHGSFGEDGELQAFLEKHNIPFVGPNATACRKMFHKKKAADILLDHGFDTLPSALLVKGSKSNEDIIREFFKKHKLDRAIVKPVAGGSSIGVFSVESPQEAFHKSQDIFNLNIDTEVILEPFCRGTEFTIIVLQGADGAPVALIPSQIQVNYEKDGDIFDYRRKYLPTNNTKWPCPPHFEDKLVEKIQTQAEQLFRLFGIRDFTRLDGWILEGGRVVFTDLNPISGMEQNSFIFQQSSRIGLTHKEVLWNMLSIACKREGIEFKKLPVQKNTPRQPVYILFGDDTAERQVSLMSGTNVWLKLMKSKKYEPKPFLLDKRGYVWELSYTYALNHTVEEIYDNCVTANATVGRLQDLSSKIQKRLTYAPQNYDARQNIPTKLSLDTFLNKAKNDDAFIFLALHGGKGEDGTIQQTLEDKGLYYNGSRPEASELCMDKYITGNAVSKIGDQKIKTCPKTSMHISKFDSFDKENYADLWQELEEKLGTKTLIVKPRYDGCSAGIVRLFNAEELQKYIQILNSKAAYIPANSFTNQKTVIEMAQDQVEELLIEAFIETDHIDIKGNNLFYTPQSGWLELTVGVLESQGDYHALNPSITIAEGEVLSLEEKFQGGTGVNITPPPKDIISEAACQNIKTSIEKIANKLGIENYVRIDIFYNVKTEEIIVIEANSLPGLTASTVIYHQGLAETPPLDPCRFLENLIDMKIPNVLDQTKENHAAKKVANP